MEKKMDTYNKNDKHNKGPSSNLWIGLAFIAGGVMVLLNQSGWLSLNFNWWAFFIVIPAIGSFGNAYNRYRTTNNLFDMGVMMPALIGLFMIGLMFNLLSGNGWNFNWNLLWPLMFIIIGLGMIFGRSRTE
jgi:hypothetical protein